MIWKFVDVNDAEKELRRQTLNRYAGYAQLSALGPVFLVLVYRLARWVIKTIDAQRPAYDSVPHSPRRKERRRSGLGALEARYRLVQWWLGDDVVFLGQSWGRRDELVFGLVWGAWMAILCVLETGDDYLHLTKRIGLIAISQMPLQYILALKSLNPIAFVLRSSHEEINRYHRALGRIIHLLLLAHAILYLNFFAMNGLLLNKLASSRPTQTGIFGIICMDLLGVTAWKIIRDYSYRVFFITHLTVAIIIPPLIWFHAHSAKVFVAEAILVFLADIVSRKLDTVTATATLEPIPATSLVKVTTSVPFHKIGRFQRHPGSHIYLQIPSDSRRSQDPYSKDYLVHEFLFNPFTVAAVDAENSELTLVARHLRGPTTSTLRQLAAQAAPNKPVTLGIEGPYGAAARCLPSLAGGDYDRVLLVSGGVGATFTVPLFRALAAEAPAPASRVQLVWSVRTPADAAWVLSEEDGQGRPFAEHPGVQLYVTGISPRGATEAGSGEQGGVEMRTIRKDEQDVVLLEGEGEGEEEGEGDEGVRGGEVLQTRAKRASGGRPDLKKIVDELFRQGLEERVAVLFCGPTEMGRELRRHVGVWVRKGREVFWHSESFEW